MLPCMNSVYDYVMTPNLYFLLPDWDKLGRLLCHTLVWNPHDGHHTKIPTRSAQLKKTQRLAELWKPASVMLEKSDREGDFVAICGETFAVKPHVWEAIRPLVHETVEALPVTVDRLIDPHLFDFPPLSAAERPQYVMLHGISNIRMPQGYVHSVKISLDEPTLGKYRGQSIAGCLFQLDPKEIAGKHLFLMDGEWIASQVFVDLIKQRGFSGLIFRPVKYQLINKPSITHPKKVLPPPPRPDFELAAQGFSTTLAEQWMSLWNWSYAAFKNRKWSPKKPKLGRPIALKTIEAFEKKHGIKLPHDYVEVLTQFAGSITIDHGSPDDDVDAGLAWEEVDDRITSLMIGGGELWTFDIKEESDGFREWANAWLAAEEGEPYYEHFRHKVPIISIGDGDYVTLDLVTGIPTWISHDGDDRTQGLTLGRNFTDFITRWAWAGTPDIATLGHCAQENNQPIWLQPESAIIKFWHDWLRGMPLPEELE